jgi:hypothetical protein
VPQDKWIEDIFSGAHGSSRDKDGNLYIKDWNVAGRIMKLARQVVARRQPRPRRQVADFGANGSLPTSW